MATKQAVAKVGNLYLIGDVWHFRKMVNGHPINKTTKTGDIKQAKQLAALWEAEAIQNIVRDGLKPLTVGQTITRYLDERKNLSSYRAMVSTLKVFSTLENKKLHEVEKTELVTIINGMRTDGKAEGTVALAVRYWNTLMNYAAKHKVKPGPKLDVFKPKANPRRTLTADEEARLLAALVPPAKQQKGCPEHTIVQMQDNYDLVVCLLELGCRYHELANAEWKQVNMTANMVHLKRGKGGTDSTHYISDRLRIVLERRIADDPEAVHLFPSMVGKSKNLNFLHKAAKRAGIDVQGSNIVLHSMRHTYATTMLKEGLQLPEVQQLLGHKRIETTMQYIHLLPTATAARALEVQQRRQQQVDKQE